MTLSSFAPRQRSVGLSSRSGLTVLEVMIAITVMTLLATIGLVGYRKGLERAREVQAIGDIAHLTEDIKDYYATHWELPESLDQVQDEVPLDPWGNPYQYFRISPTDPAGCREARNHDPLNSDYDLYSLGPDGATATWVLEENGLDDIVRANDGEYIGVAEKY